MTCLFKTLSGELHFLLGEKWRFAFVGCARQHKEADDAQGDGYAGVDDEHPPPARKTMDTIEIVHRGSLQQARRQGPQVEADIEYATSTTDLVAAIPGTEDVMNLRRTCQGFIGTES